MSDKGEILVTVNEKHDIHHVRERGYVESPARVRVIKQELEKNKLFSFTPVKHYAETHITNVHDKEYFNYFKLMCDKLEPGKSLYPYVFPRRNAARKPRERAVKAGYYCIDTFTPLNKNAFLAAKRAVDCGLTLAEETHKGKSHLSYALVRPPGHHAERDAFGGFCYFNTNAIMAQYLASQSNAKIAILDIDYHHGNGQQDIFYARPDVLTISLHGSPSFAYPYFTGFEDETGTGDGVGYNLNIPMAEKISVAHYQEALRRALSKIKKFKPEYLIVALGVDIAKADPTGTWEFMPDDFFTNGTLVGTLGLPTTVIQEGGYDTKVVGMNVRKFLEGVQYTL